MKTKAQDIWEFRWEIFAFFVGISSAVAADLLVADLIESIMLGILVTVGLTVSHEIWVHRITQKDTTNTFLTISDSTSETLRQLCDALSRRAGNTARELQLLKWSVREVSAEQMPEVWNTLLWQFDESYNVTNYSLGLTESSPKNSPSQSFYTEHFAKFAHELQALKIEHKARVRRIMLVDSPFELYETLDTIEKQRNAGMNVRYMFAARVMDPESVLNWKRAGLESEDFGIFDSSCVLLWKNHPIRRTVSGGRVIWETSEVEKYIQYFERIFTEAHELPIVKLRHLTEHQRREIGRWPSYRGRNAEYDYALRSGGWLDEHWEKPDSTCFGAFANGRLVGFSILGEDGASQAEFFVAVHPELLSRGYGHAITISTLYEGFRNLRLERIHLRVRSWNHRAQSIYETLGFHETETKPHGKERIQGKDVHMTYMHTEVANFEGQLPRAGDSAAKQH